MRDRPLVLHTRVVRGSGGGPDRTILNSPRFLEKRGYDSTCLYLRPPGDPGFDLLAERASAWRAPLEAVDDRGALDLNVLREADRICRALRPRIWHGHDYKSNFLGVLLARRHRFRLVTTVHGWVNFTWKTPLYYAIDRSSLKRYERVVCVSKGELDQCLRSGVRPERCTLLHNAVDLERFRPPGSGEGRRTEARDRRISIGAIGRLEEEKGFDLLIDACAALLDEGIDLELRIAGEGVLRESLQAAVDARGLSSRVHFHGFVGEIETFHRERDLFVLSSRREGLPQVLLESMATGTPSVTTRLPGLPDEIVDGRNALVVDTGSRDALRDAMRTLIEDPVLRDRLGGDARRTIEENFSFAARMTKMADLYDDLLAEDGN